MSKRVYPVLILFLVLLLPWSRVGAEQPPEDANEPGEWIEYQDPYWAFSILYPPDWYVQNSPVKDFGFRFSSPDYIPDALGRPLQGAYLSVSVKPSDDDDLDNYIAQVYALSELSTTEQITISGINGEQITGLSKDGHHYISWIVYSYEHLYHFRFVSDDTTSLYYSEIADGMLSSVMLLQKPVPYRLTPLEYNILNQEFNFLEIKHPFPSGPGQIISGYDNGDWHRGGDLYAVDICDETGCTEEMEGAEVLAPTNMKYVGSTQGGSGEEDYHFFEIADNGQRKLCLSLAHFDLDLNIGGGEIQRGQIIGHIRPHPELPHYHMGIWSVPATTVCNSTSRQAIPFDEEYSLDGVLYKADTDWSNDIDVISTNSLCPLPQFENAVIVYQDQCFECNGEEEGVGYIRISIPPFLPLDGLMTSLPDSFGASSISIPSGYLVELYVRNDYSPPIARIYYDGDETFLNNSLRDPNSQTYVLLDNNVVAVRLLPDTGFCSAFPMRLSDDCIPNQPPNSPILSQPENGHTVYNYLVPTLCWNNSNDPDGDEVEFNVNIYNGTTNITYETNNTCWRPSQLDYQYGSYQWRVQARDAGNATSNWSTTWSFSIAPPNRPPSIDFNTANGDTFASSTIFSRDTNWTFAGTASDPEGALNRVEFRCAGDNCGTHHSQTGLGGWTYERHGLAGQNDVYFMAFDNAGNYNYSRHLDLRIDLVAPTTQASLNGEANVARWPSWFRDPVAVRLAASDGSTGRARAGVKEIRYRVNGGAWQTHSGDGVNFTLSTDGAHTVEYYAVDNVGNTESTHTINLQIDQTPPSSPAGIAETHGVAHNVWQKAQNTPAFTWNASTDATSGVWGYQFYFGKDPNGIGYQTFRAADPRQWTPQPGGVHTGIYYLRGRTRDNAGNWSVWTDLFTFRYDETSPENPDDVVHTDAITSTIWQRVTNTPDFVWTTPHDEGSGVQGYYVYWGAEPEGTASNFITSPNFQDSTSLCAVDAACTGYLRLRSVDNVDNVANEWSTGFVLRYDNVPPVVDFTFNNGLTMTDQTRVILNITASDEGSGVQAMRFSPDGQDWLPWEVYTTTHAWFIPGISRQYWPVYVQVRDGVGLESPVISHTVYLDVNRKQPRSTNFRLFDYTLSAGAGAYTSTVYSGRGTAGQIMDGAVVTSTNFQVAWGYEAGNQALPLIIPGHDDFTYINGIFASGTGATTLTSTHFMMLGTFNEIGLPNTTTLTSTAFTHQPGFLAAAPTVRPSELPTQTVGPPPLPEPPLACETPYLLINEDAPFTEHLTVTLNLCAPRGEEMLVSNNITFTGATWEPYTTTKTWVLSDTGPQTTARFVYVMFKDDKGTIHEAYFDDVIYDTSVPSMTILLGTDIPMEGVQASQRASAGIANTGVRYIEMQADGQSQWVPMLTANTEGTVPIYVGGTDANSGIAEVQFSDNITFTDTIWEPYAPVKLYAPPGEDGLKTVYARARDGAGNVSSIITGSFFYDTHTPAGDVVFDTFAVRPDAITATLYTGAWDNASGVSDVRVSTSPTFTDAAWEPYTYTLVVPISLTTQSSLTMYAQYRDLSGNLSDVYSDRLYVDGEPPVVYVDVSATELSTDTGSIVLPVRTVTIYAYDDHSGIANRYISNDPLMQRGVVTLSYTSSITWNFDETRIAWVQVEDSLGNLSEPHPVYASETAKNYIYLPLVMKH